MVVIIDYGMGNLQSVFNAFKYIGADVAIGHTQKDLENAQGIVMPGVGTFGEGMRNLEKLDLIKTLETEVLQKGKAFLGICLGMQLLATKGLEQGEYTGLNWIKGVVDKIKIQEFNNQKLRIPHIGWNDVSFKKKDGLYTGLGDSQAFYFMHSYVLYPQDQSVVSGNFSYSTNFVASIEINNIYATQFHPEKSHTVGLSLLKNWYRKIKIA
jgi:imidazole glycerol-phosphate synthase subunit HisH